eukprot:TRINITY_DN2865_c0_g1_i11.p2 TRINITY_DN2865_c0_g1~~TRINITY_DN2865_c0_g1_i11.p2  ORF type:complete len:202 (-),score=-13.81 TRINITY_DN2865_c0_g1_i11:1339-1944(-)
MAFSFLWVKKGFASHKSRKTIVLRHIVFFAHFDLTCMYALHDYIHIRQKLQNILIFLQAKEHCRIYSEIVDIRLQILVNYKLKQALFLVNLLMQIVVNLSSFRLSIRVQTQYFYERLFQIATGANLCKSIVQVFIIYQLRGGYIESTSGVLQPFHISANRQSFSYYYDFTVAKQKFDQIYGQIMTVRRQVQQLVLNINIQH